MPNTLLTANGMVLTGDLRFYTNKFPVYLPKALLTIPGREALARLVAEYERAAAAVNVYNFTQYPVPDDFFLRLLSFRMRETKVTLTDIYSNAVLGPETMNRIRGKELARDYPFDRLNDLRATMNYAPYYMREFAHATQRLDLASWLRNPRNITTTRCVRIHMAFLLGLAINAKASVVDLSCLVIDALDLLSIEIVRRVKTYPLCEYVSDYWLRSLPDEAFAKVSPKLCALLYSTVRELADLAGYGEQSLYASAPIPIRTQPTTIAHTFFEQRTPSSFPHVITFCYDIDESVRLPQPNCFRGTLGAAVPVTSLLRWRVWIDGVKIKSDELLSVYISATRVALLETASRQEPNRARSLDLEKMIAYSSEIHEWYHGSNVTWTFPDDARGSVERNTIAQKYIGPDGTYAESFCLLINEGLNTYAR